MTTKNRKILDCQGSGFILEFWQLSPGGGFLVWLKTAEHRVVEKHFFQSGDKDKAAFQYDLLKRNKIQGLNLKKAMEQLALFA